MRDFLKDNLEILSHKSPELCSLIKNAPNDNQYNITTSKSGIATLSRVCPDGTIVSSPHHGSDFKKLLSLI